MDHDSATAAGLVATLFFFYAILVLAIIAVTIWIYWRIFSKAGFNGALALLNLVPGIGQLICIIILAFGRWPIEDQLAAAYGPHVPPTMPPPPPSPPGSSVMPT